MANHIASASRDEAGAGLSGQITPRRPSAARVAARKLRERILLLEEGSLLGSEEELMTQLEVSRDTLRQTMRLLENDGLVTIRRGVGGGFFSCKPDAEAAVRAAALYWRVRNVTMPDVMAATQSLILDVIRLAAQSTNESLRKKLQLLLARISGDARSHDSAAWQVQDEIEVMNCVLELAANPVLELLVMAATRFGLREVDIDLAIQPELRSIRRADTLRLGEAILRREPDKAVSMAERQLKAILPWLENSRAAASAATRQAEDIGNGQARASE